MHATKHNSDNAQSSPDDVKELRRSSKEQDSALSDEARTWLASIDATVRPAHVAASCPRLVNQIAKLWRRPRELNRYFDELLMDKRGTRGGFSMEVISEINKLKEHFQTIVFPSDKITPYDPFRDCDL